MSISADGAAVDAAVVRLRKASAAIEHELAELAATAARLRDDWSGEAQRSFDAAYAAWSRETAAMGRILGQAIVALQAADTAAGEAETAAAALWS